MFAWFSNIFSIVDVVGFFLSLEYSFRRCHFRYLCKLKGFSLAYQKSSRAWFAWDGIIFFQFYYLHENERTTKRLIQGTFLTHSYKQDFTYSVDVTFLLLVNVTKQTQTQVLWAQLNNNITFCEEVFFCAHMRKRRSFLSFLFITSF